MNDREFIELLNLYIDKEISPEDAVRLEAEVLSRPDRREIYTQYCKMQKACSLLTEDFANEAVPAAAAARSPWGLSPLMVGLAAACVLAALGVRWSGVLSRNPSVPAATPATLVQAPAPATRPDEMQAVFQARPVAPLAARNPAGSFVSYSPSLQASQLNWIGDVRLAPLASGPAQDFLVGPKTDLKSAALSDAQAARDLQQQGDMAAFRFQR